MNTTGKPFNTATITCLMRRTRKCFKIFQKILKSVNAVDILAVPRYSLPLDGGVVALTRKSSLMLLMKQKLSRVEKTPMFLRS